LGYRRKREAGERKSRQRRVNNIRYCFHKLFPFMIPLRDSRGGVPGITCPAIGKELRCWGVSTSEARRVIYASSRCLSGTVPDFFDKIHLRTYNNPALQTTRTRLRNSRRFSLLVRCAGHLISRPNRGFQFGKRTHLFIGPHNGTDQSESHSGLKSSSSSAFSSSSFASSNIPSSTHLTATA